MLEYLSYHSDFKRVKVREEIQVDDHLVETNEQLMITLPAEFNFKTNLNHLKERHDNCLDHIKNNTITRLIKTSNRYTLAQISVKNNDKLIVKLLLRPKKMTDNERNELLQFITDWFDLDTNLAPFYQMAKEDNILKHIVKDNYGLRNIGFPDLFEALCTAVMSQQINLAFAARLKCEFIKSYGHSITYNGEDYWAFPTPETIASLSKEQMAHLKTTERKKECIIHIAQAIASGSLSKEILIKINDPKLIMTQLTKIKGIGPWTAEYILMRCLRYPTTFPVKDIGLLNAIKHVKGLNERPTEQDVLTLFNRWTNWQSYAAYYLWKTLY